MHAVLRPGSVNAEWTAGRHLPKARPERTVSHQMPSPHMTTAMSVPRVLASGPRLFVTICCSWASVGAEPGVNTAAACAAMSGDG